MMPHFITMSVMIAFARIVSATDDSDTQNEVQKHKRAILWNVFAKEQGYRTMKMIALVNKAWKMPPQNPGILAGITRERKSQLLDGVPKDAGILKYMLNTSKGARTNKWFYNCPGCDYTPQMLRNTSYPQYDLEELGDHIHECYRKNPSANWYYPETRISGYDIMKEISIKLMDWEMPSQHPKFGIIAGIRLNGLPRYDWFDYNPESELTRMEQLEDRYQTCPGCGWTRTGNLKTLGQHINACFNDWLRAERKRVALGD